MFRFSKLGRAPILAATTALTLGVAMAVSNAQEKVTVTFANWATAEGTTAPAMEEVIAKFEAANPNIDIVSESISFSEIAQQLVLRIRSGNPPDVAQVAGNDTFLLASTGKLEPLGDHVDAELEAQLKPESISGLRVNDQLIAFPWIQAPAGFWYNKAIMEEAGLDPENPPKTIDELMAAMEAIKASQPDVIPLGLDTTNRPFSLSSNWPWMLTFGAKPVGEGATGAESPEMIAYLEWMRELAQKGYIDPGRKIGEFRPLAAQGKVAFHWDQVLLQGVIQSTNSMADEAFYEQWGVTTMPAGASGESYSFEGGHQLIVFADSEQKEAAWTFVNYLATSPEAIAAYTLGPGASLPPVQPDALGDLASQVDTPIFNSFMEEIMPTVAPQPYGAEFAAAATAIMAGVQQAVTGDEPIAGIASSIQQQLDRQ